MKVEKINQFNPENRPIIDVGTPIQIEVEGVSSRLKTTLVGIDPGKFLLIKTPQVVTDGNVGKELTHGDKVIARYLYNGAVVGFESKLIDDISSSIKLLIIEYPKSVENFDLRSKKRIHCLLPAGSDFNGEKMNGGIIDLSEGGCRYQIKTVNGQKLPGIQVDDQMTLFGRFPGKTENCEIPGKVRHVILDDQKKLFGIQYIDMSPEIKSIIQEYISSVRDFI